MPSDDGERESQPVRQSPAAPAAVADLARHLIRDPDGVAGWAREAARAGPPAGFEPARPASASEDPFLADLAEAGLLEHGADMVERVADGAVPKDTMELAALEAIILLYGRPALFFKNGRMDCPPAGWKHLEAARVAIERVAASVARLEVSPPPNPRWTATAFVVGPGLLMTARHVAAALTDGDAVTAAQKPRLDTRVNYRAETDAAEPATSEVVAIAGIHADYDLALLRTADDDPAVEDPGTLIVAGDEPHDLDGLEVYVVGHPVQDGQRNDAVHMMRIFERIFRVKRLQPGFATGMGTHQHLEVLQHDCSTLWGNSGSCVVDLDSGKVIGLHFGGEYREFNVAVPVWRLVDDPLMTHNGVVFG